MGFNGPVRNVFAGFGLSRVKELQKIRSQIATDLHDDIGSGLSQIAIMTEVIAKRIPAENDPVAESLRQIATASRELVDSMSDIVWSVNPNKDNTENLIQRMRCFANAILDGHEIEFQFQVSGKDLDRRLHQDIRRHLFLVFKEAITNALRHSCCTSLQIEIHIEKRQLIISIADNGKGFDPLNHTFGNGVGNMRMRMKEVKGNLEVISVKGQGTTIRQLAPLERQKFCWKEFIGRGFPFRHKWNRAERLLRQSA
ncbi:MAG TPA: ATP-binding protein [Acidobacteriota bacterium]|nr:ATP-binding protein [Acidobacteriota bacterium]